MRGGGGSSSTVLRDGKGRLVCVDGLSFDGEWRNNMRNGHGVLTFPNGDTYAGAWLDDQKHGKGVDTFVNGNRFEGPRALAITVTCDHVAHVNRQCSTTM